jgi:hypothetical protein
MSNRFTSTCIGWLRQLRPAEIARAAFISSLEEAQAEAERDGRYSLEDVMAEADQIIAAKRAQDLTRPRPLLEEILTISSSATAARGPRYDR